MEHVYTKGETKRAVAWCSWQKWGKRGEPSASRRINPKDRVVLSILSSRIPAASDRERKRKARANIESVDVDPILSFKIYVKRETVVPPPRVYSLRWPRSEQSSPLLSSDWRGENVTAKYLEERLMKLSLFSLSISSNCPNYNVYKIVR